VNDTPFHLIITREPWGDYFVFVLPNGDSLQFDPDEAREWLKVHGANEEAAEKALDHCWNFYHVELDFTNYREPKRVYDPMAPNV